MTALATRSCECTVETAMGQKRPKRCVLHGNPFISAASLEREKTPRTPLRRESEKRTSSGRRRGSTLNPGRGFAVTPAQREKVKGKRCVGCGREASEYVAIDPMHLWPRGLGGCDDPLCVLPGCRDIEGGCHRRLDDPSDPFDLLPKLIDGGYYAELAHAIEAHQLSPLTLLERTTGRRWQPSPLREVAR